MKLWSGNLLQIKILWALLGLNLIIQMDDGYPIKFYWGGIKSPNASSFTQRVSDIPVVQNTSN